MLGTHDSEGLVVANSWPALEAGLHVRPHLEAVWHLRAWPLSGQLTWGGAVIQDRPNQETFAWLLRLAGLMALIPALDFALVSPLHNTLHVDAVWVIKKQNKNKTQNCTKNHTCTHTKKTSKHSPSIFLICSLAALPFYLLRSSLSCFRLNYNLVLGHFVRHSAWSPTNTGKEENKWDATCLKGIQTLK